MISIITKLSYIYETIVVTFKSLLMERLTQPEEDALRVLWLLSGGFVKDVLDGLPALPGTTLPGTTLPGTTLPGTTLPGTTLPGTTALPGTTLPGTTLPGTALPGTTQRPPYTTLASTLRNLERKGYVRSEKLGNSFRFVPVVTADDYQRRSLGTLVKQHFQDSYKDLVSFFAQENKISAADLQEIIDLIERKKAE